MIKRVKKEKFVKEEWVITERKCDRCGALCPNPEGGNWYSEGPWQHTRVRFAIYTTVDECREIDEIDLCPRCAEIVMKECKAYKGE